MCTSSATLVYGITLQALELCLAGAAYKAVKPALVAVDLVRARKANGTLHTSTPERRATVCAIPVEIWDLVERHVTRQGYLQQWLNVENAYDWSDSDWPESEYDGPSGGDSLKFVGALQGEMSFDSFMEDGGVRSYTDDCRTRVVDMLEAFGLCLATVDLISKEESSYFDFAASWAVGIPLVRDGDKAKAYPHVHAEIPHEADPSHTLVRISPSTFDLPTNAPVRFRRLLSSFPALVPTSHTTGTIRPPPARPPSSSQVERDAEKKTVKAKLSKEERREQEKEKKRAAREPGWMLIGSGSTCS
ncbi:hypothetical protein JCM3775_006741 [Rhodotorula graminis]